MVQRCGAVEIFDFANSTYAKISRKASHLGDEDARMKSTAEVKFVYSKKA